MSYFKDILLLMEMVEHLGTSPLLWCEAHFEKTVDSVQGTGESAAHWLSIYKQRHQSNTSGLHLLHSLHIG